MSDESTDQNLSPEALDAEPQGTAALLLVESLLHGLIARSILSVEDGVEIVTVASDVCEEIAADQGRSLVDQNPVLSLLKAINNSLERDIPATRASDSNE